MVRHIPVGLLLVALASPVTARAAGGAWTPSAAQIAELERHVPKQPSQGLDHSSRTYAGIVTNGHRLIVGEISPADTANGPGVHIGTALPPPISDGGCGVINLTYDPARHRFIGYACNGQA